MNKSESIKELATALAKAQGEFPVIPKTKVAKVKMKAGGEYSYNYADLSDIIKSTAPILSKHGIAVSQDYVLIGQELFIETMLLHSSGEWKTSFCPLRFLTTPQEQGSENTYYRRYSLCAALNIHAEEDDDGAIAGDKGHDYSSAVKKQSYQVQQSNQSQGPSLQTSQSTVAATIKSKIVIPVASIPEVLNAPESSPVDFSFDYGHNINKPVEPVKSNPETAIKTPEAKERAKLMADLSQAMVKAKWTAEQTREYSKRKFGAESSGELTNAEVQEMIKIITLYKYEELI